MLPVTHSLHLGGERQTYRLTSCQKKIIVLQRGLEPHLCAPHSGDDTSSLIFHRLHIIFIIFFWKTQNSAFHCFTLFFSCIYMFTPASSQLFDSVKGLGCNNLSHNARANSVNDCCNNGTLQKCLDSFGDSTLPGLIPDGEYSQIKVKMFDSR